MNTQEIGYVLVIVTAIVQAIKLSNVNKRWIPVIAVSLGVIGGVFLGGIGWLAAVAGIMTGLGSIGLYEVTKTSIAGK